MPLGSSSAALNEPSGIEQDCASAI
jgi:hypothetical protein